MLSPLRDEGPSCPLTTIGPQDRRMVITRFIPSHPANSSLWLSRASLAVACLVYVLMFPATSPAKTKPNRAPRPEPELKILDLKISPNPYTISAGPVEFSALVQLPKDLNGATLLEVSSLVTSLSKTSIRFLSARQPLEPYPALDDTAEQPQISVVLAWDGMDHNKVPA